MKRVSELFELSKLEAKEPPLQREPFLLADLVTEVFAEFQLLAQQKNLAFECIDCDQLAPCFADVSLIDRVIQNLVENTIRYTPDGSFVHMELENNTSFVRVSVLNSTHVLPEPVWTYMQGSASVRPPNVGSGLMIVRKILMLHETELSVERCDDDRLCFSFVLPAYKPPVASAS